MQVHSASPGTLREITAGLWAVDGDGMEGGFQSPCCVSVHLIQSKI